MGQPWGAGAGASPAAEGAMECSWLWRLMAVPVSVPELVPESYPVLELAFSSPRIAFSKLSFLFGCFYVFLYYVAGGITF